LHHALARCRRQPYIQTILKIKKMKCSFDGWDILLGKMIEEGSFQNICPRHSTGLQVSDKCTIEHARRAATQRKSEVAIRSYRRRIENSCLLLPLFFVTNTQSVRSSGQMDICLFSLFLFFVDLKQLRD
jgi:hypothetical protein